MNQKHPDRGSLRKDEERKARLAAELRENLKRRKEQKRVRARLTQVDEKAPGADGKGER